LLPKPYRLPSYLIPEVLARGKKYYSSLLVLSINNQQSQPKAGRPWAETINNPVSRFAIIIPIKVDKRAVKRNKLKRQIREIIKLNIANLKPGSDVIIMAKKTILGKEFNELRKDLEGLLKKTKLVIARNEMTKQSN